MAALFLLIGFLFLIALFGLINAAIFYFAWNLAVVPIFHMQEVSLLQAWLLGMLLSMVLGALRRKG